MVVFNAQISVSSTDDTAATEPNPAYGSWIQQYQAILSAILASSTNEVACMVLFASNSHEAWSILDNSHASQLSARAMKIRAQLGAITRWRLCPTLGVQLSTPPPWWVHFISVKRTRWGVRFTCRVGARSRYTSVLRRFICSFALNWKTNRESRRAAEMSVNAVRFSGHLYRSNHRPKSAPGSSSKPASNPKRHSSAGRQVSPNRSSSSLPICQI